MKKFIFNQSPFVLLLVPVLFALVMSISSQVGRAEAFSQQQFGSVPATSLFTKGVHVVQTLCTVAKLKAW